MKTILCPDCNHSIDDHDKGGCLYRHLLENVDSERPMCDCIHSPSIIAVSVVKSLRVALKHLYSVAVEAVEHVGYANYEERQREAIGWIRQAYDDAFVKEKV